MKLLILLIAIILASCTAKTVPVVLQAPPELILPHVSAAELSCIADDVYIRLVVRDKMQTERRQTLREIIESTQNKGTFE